MNSWRTGKAIIDLMGQEISPIPVMQLYYNHRKQNKKNKGGEREAEKEKGEAPSSIWFQDLEFQKNTKYC